MITPEEKARIARENGAKSKGPNTQEGKDRSRLNSLKHGDFADPLRFLVPPHVALTCMDDRQKFFTLFQEFVSEYRPIGNSELRIVRDMAIARWKIDRAESLETALMNREITRRVADFESADDADLAAIELTLAVDEHLAGHALIKEYRKIARENARAFRQHVRFLAQHRRDFPPSGHEPAKAEKYKDEDLIEIDVESELAAEMEEEAAVEQQPEPAEQQAETKERTNPESPQTTDNKEPDLNPWCNIRNY